MISFITKKTRNLTAGNWISSKKKAAWKKKIEKSKWYQVPAYRLIAKAALPQFSLFIIVAFVGGLSALFEGITFGLLAVALDLLSNHSSAKIIAPDGIFAGLLSGFSLPSVFVTIVGLIAVAQIFRSITGVGSSLLNTILASRIAASIQRMILEEVLRLDFASASRFKSGELTSHITSHGEAVAFACRGALDLFINLATMVAYVAVLCSISPYLFLLTTILFSIIVFFQKIVTRKINSISIRLQESATKLSRRIVEAVMALRLIHSYHSQHAIFRQVTELQDSFIANLLSLQKRMALISPLADSIMVIGMGVFLLLGFFFFKDDQANLLPSLLTFIAVLNRLSGRVSTSSSVVTQIQSMLARLRIVDELFEGKNLTYTKFGGIQFVGLATDIKFDNVSLTYQGREKPAVDQVSFTIPKGKSIALIGGSGSGKSSLADLLLGLFEPTSGKIVVDGIPLNEIDPASWRCKIGVVSQDTILFNSTVFENITFAEPSASREDVLNAIKMAHAEDFINSLPQGLETVIGERGFMLSGGQRQRLAIARALVRKPDLLILDEATSALDSTVEQSLQSTLEELERTVTCLVIAHRLSTVKNSFRIYVMEQGKVIESGTHEELLKINGYYFKAWENQSKSISVA